MELDRLDLDPCTVEISTIRNFGVRLLAYVELDEVVCTYSQFNPRRDQNLIYSIHFHSYCQPRAATSCCTPFTSPLNVQFAKFSSTQEPSENGWKERKFVGACHSVKLCSGAIIELRTARIPCAMHTTYVTYIRMYMHTYTYTYMHCTIHACIHAYIDN